MEAAARNNWPQGLDLMLDKVEEIGAPHLVNPKSLLRVAVTEPLWTSHTSPTKMAGFILRRLGE